jgi:hypothetical protein
LAEIVSTALYLYTQVPPLIPLFFVESSPLGSVVLSTDERLDLMFLKTFGQIFTSFLILPSADLHLFTPLYIHSTPAHVLRSDVIITFSPFVFVFVGSTELT